MSKERQQSGCYHLLSFEAKGWASGGEYRTCTVCGRIFDEDEWGAWEIEEEPRKGRPDGMTLAKDAAVNRALDKQGGV